MCTRQLQNKLKSFDLPFLFTQPLPPYLCKVHTRLPYVAHTTLLQKSHILFWCFFTFVLKGKEESEWLVRIDAILRIGVVEWRKWQFFGICGLFWAQVNVMICVLESMSVLGFLNCNSFCICDWSMWWSAAMRHGFWFVVWSSFCFMVTCEMKFLLGSFTSLVHANFRFVLKPGSDI